MGFWDNMAHSYRNTRAVLAALMLLVILVLALYLTRCTPAVLFDEVREVPVLEVRRAGEDAKLYHLRIAPGEGEEVWMRWYGGGAAPSVGSQVRVRVTGRADGTYEYRLLQGRNI